MKIIILLLLSITSFGKTIVIPLNHSYLIDGQKEKINGVYDTIKMVGLRGPTGFVNVHGTSLKPIVIIGLNVKASTAVGNAVSFDNCSYFRFTGAFLEGGNMCLEFRYLTTNYEVDHVKIIGAGYAGIVAKTDPNKNKPETLRGAFTMRDVYIHDCFISTLTGEGMYIGNSHFNDPNYKEHETTGVRIINNIVDGTGADGIQVYSTNAVVSGNIVKNFGKTAGTGQNSGIQIQPGFVGEVSYNFVQNGTGIGIFAGGSGNSILKGNIVSGASTGILVATYAPFQLKGWTLEGNTVTGNRNEALYIFDTIGSTATNNVFQGLVRLNGGAKWLATNTIK